MIFAGPRAWTTQEVTKIFVVGFKIFLQVIFIALSRLLGKRNLSSGAAAYAFGSLFFPFRL